MIERKVSLRLVFEEDTILLSSNDCGVVAVVYAVTAEVLSIHKHCVGVSASVCLEFLRRAPPPKRLLFGLFDNDKSRYSCSKVSMLIYLTAAGRMIHSVVELK